MIFIIIFLLLWIVFWEEYCDVTPDYVSKLYFLTNLNFWFKKQPNLSQGFVWDSINFFKNSISYWAWLIYCPSIYISYFLENSIFLSFWIFDLLTSPEPFIRDYKDLWQLADLIKYKTLNICYKWKSIHKLNDKEIENLKKALEQYLSSDPLIKFEYKNLNWITYIDFYVFLYRLIKFHQEALIFSAWSSFESVNNKIKNFYNSYCDWKKWWCTYFYNFNLNNNIFNIIANYDKCPFLKYDFFKNLWKINSRFKKDWKNSVERFKRAYERLKETLNNITSWLTDYEAYLATSYRWREYKAWTWWINPFTLKRFVFSVEQDLKKEWQEFKTPFAELSDRIYRAWNTVIDMYNTSKLNAMNITWDSKQRKYKQDLAQKMLKENIINALDKIDALNAETLFKEVKMDPTPITRMFPDLTYFVTQGISVIWWKEYSDSLIWILWKACEKQCSNVPSICRYY